MLSALLFDSMGFYAFDCELFLPHMITYCNTQHVGAKEREEKSRCSSVWAARTGPYLTLTRHSLTPNFTFPLRPLRSSRPIPLRLAQVTRRMPRSLSRTASHLRSELDCCIGPKNYTFTCTSRKQMSMRSTQYGNDDLK